MPTQDANSIPRHSAVPHGAFAVNIPWDFLEEWLANYSRGLYKLDLSPDYQRFHVWTPEQQAAYMEFILSGGESGKVLYFNHPNWMGSYEGTLELVDGKQRMEAVRAFLRSEVPVFGSLFKDFTDNLGFGSGEFRVQIAKLPTRKLVLQWYLAINAGGTPHTSEELDRVRNLLDLEK